MDDLNWFTKTMSRVCQEDIGDSAVAMVEPMHQFVDFLRYQTVESTSGRSVVVLEVICACSDMFFDNFLCAIFAVFLCVCVCVVILSLRDDIFDWFVFLMFFLSDYHCFLCYS